MAAPNATRRPCGGASAVVIDLDEQITIENTATTCAGQATVLPSLAAARAHLVEVIRHKPELAPEPSPRRDWVRIPTTIATPRMIATVVGVTTRAVLYWRAGERTPRWRHKRKLLMLQAMVRRAQP